MYWIEKIELHQGYVVESFLNDLSMITTVSPIISGYHTDSFIEYGILAPSSFTPKSKVSHIVTNLRAAEPRQALPEFCRILTRTL